MELQQFRVTNFRSVRDSGWIKAEEVTALIGVNESGKTNLLLPLWKFNPAEGGEIIPTADYPKKMFGEIRANPKAYKFIEADFEIGDLAGAISKLTGVDAAQLDVVRLSKHYDDKFRWEFPHYQPVRAVPVESITEALSKAARDIAALTPLKGETEVQPALVRDIEEVMRGIDGSDVADTDYLDTLVEKLENALPAEPMKTSAIAPRMHQLLDAVRDLRGETTQPGPTAVDGVWKLVWDALPKFVYYSNYGNLDSEIYLPHVVENLEREDLGAKESAKARTLRVLFRFVRLEPSEILELGQEFHDPDDESREPTADEVEEIAIKKKERSILLQSAGALLTEKFREWWKQGDYRFRFEADGNHFRIWVSDDLRSEEIELENRSTGLQWFLSFYLVFLVESLDKHEGGILLLDEPGLSLHPLAQRDLSEFFDSLANTNQLIYTTHSPFLIDSDRLDRARKVYVGEDGTTHATPDLRYTGAKRQAGAAYAVYSALNLTVAEGLLLGCSPVIVEGPSDQHYLTLIKSLLIGGRRIAPARELVFPPSGGARTAKVVAAILTGRDEQLPAMFLDGDRAGTELAKSVKTNLYASSHDKVKLVTDFCSIPDAEIEDLFPQSFLARVVDRVWRQAGHPFEDSVKPGVPIVDQIESWASAEGVELQEGWKVDLAKEAKKVGLSRGLAGFDDQCVAMWVAIFESFATEVV